MLLINCIRSKKLLTNIKALMVTNTNLNDFPQQPSMSAPYFRLKFLFYYHNFNMCFKDQSHLLFIWNRCWAKYFNWPVANYFLTSICYILIFIWVISYQTFPQMNLSNIRCEWWNLFLSFHFKRWLIIFSLLLLVYKIKSNRDLTTYFFEFYCFDFQKNKQNNTNESLIHRIIYRFS